MRLQPTLKVILLVVTLMMGCDKHQPVSKPSARGNPGAEDRYLVKFTTSDGVIPQSASARYQIINRTCIPIDHTTAVGGRRPLFQHGVEVPLHQGDNGTFTGAVYADAIVPEDYYGLGACEWELSGVDVRARTASGLDVAASVGRPSGGATTQTEKQICPELAKHYLPVYGCLSESADVAPEDYPLHVKVQLIRE
ncbi:MAG TPA: hypothetical protein VGD21_04080 [Lysobacter sp.]